jgi:hypothetical protein
MNGSIYKTNFTDRRVSVNRAITILAKNGVQVDENEATVILNFLYHIAKTYGKLNVDQKQDDLKWASNHKKVP